MTTEPSVIDPKTELLPALRDCISIVEMSSGSFAVRDTRNRSYFQTGSEEAFILQALKSGTSWESLTKSYQVQFGQRISTSDLRDFLQLLAAKNFLKSTSGLSELGIVVTEAAAKRVAEEDLSEEEFGRGSLIFYRLPLFDPDRFLTWFTGTFPFLWSKGFLVCSVLMMLCSLGIVVTNRQELTASLLLAMRWDTTILAAIAIVVATTIHEIGHGATCKRFGGMVHETGFMFLYFMPCLYVNVSDAWFIREKWKRLAITFAGGYCDLCLWAISVLVWRITLVGSLANQIAFVLATTCGTRVFLNFNPFLKLDGYYLIADGLEYPNLYSIARLHWIGFLNLWMWGAPRPADPLRPRIAFYYGMTTWLIGIVFLSFITLKLILYAGNTFGLIGTLFTTMVFSVGIRRVFFRGFIGSEFIQMFRKRYARTLVWLAILGTLVGLAFLVSIEHYATGDFEVRSARRVEVASPMHSFIARVLVQDGQEVSEGEVLAELHAPELGTQISAKSLELDQSKATLAKLTAGARAEEIQALKDKAKLLTDWCEMGKNDIDNASIALGQQLKSLNERSEQVQLQIDLGEEVLKKSEELNQKGAVTGAQLLQERSQLAVLRSQLKEFQSQHDSRKTEGVRLQQSELARREQELKATESQLLLLKLGTRKEEIEAEQAKCDRLEKELAFLQEQQERLVIRAPTGGIVSAQRIREKIGQFAPQGSELCQIEDPGMPQVEIYVSEDEAALIKHGQAVQLKARSLPFEVLRGVVDRVAPTAAKPKEAVASQQAFVRQAVVVYCSIEGADNKLKTGMTGSGRISRGKDKIATILFTRLYKYIRTEFWW